MQLKCILLILLSVEFDVLQAGADALLIKHAFLPSEESDIRTFIEEIKYMTSGDD